MPVRSSGLALLAVAGIALALTACSSSGAGTASTSATKAATGGASSSSSPSTSASPTASSGATTAAAAVPAGYRRIGGTEQGISVAVPSSWVSINLAKETLAAAASKLDVPGFSGATAEHYMQSLQKDHAVFAFDIASETSSPARYVRNIYAFCAPSGVTDTGASSVAFLTQEAKAQLSTIASQVTARDVTIGGVPGIETSYKLNSGTGVDVQGTQLVVLPKPDVACYVTLSFSKPQAPGNYLAVAAATAQFP